MLYGRKGAFLMNTFAIIWFGAMLLFLMLESSTVSLVSIWFAAGSLCAMITNFCGGALWLQVVIFLAVSIVLLASLRPMIRKFFTPKLVKTNADALIGATGRVTQDIDNDLSQGQVKLSGMEWSARSTLGDKIPTDTMIRVDRIEGVKVFVSKN